MKKVCLMKRFATVMLALVMVVTGMILIPKEADATENSNVKTSVIYSTDFTMSEYRENGMTAPIKEGYVFGGWYQDAAESDQGAEKMSLESGESEKTLKPITSDEVAEFTGAAYAKFVPANVLSVKAQNKANTSATTASTYVRLMTSLDSTNYIKVGFDIWLANKTQLKKDGGPLETSKFWDGLLVGTEERHASTIYGGESEYLAVWQLKNVAKANYSKIIYVRPYWITMDGTKVEGVAKYVHIEDEYLNLISVPVNLSSTDGVAAGNVTMSYDQTLTLYGCEEGRLLTAMRFWNDADSKTIHMIGNASALNENVTADGILANIRFKKPEATTAFTISGTFMKWNKDAVTVNGVDMNYEIATTTE